MVAKTNAGLDWTYPLSRRIPALLMRIVTFPKASMAVLMTASPSVTEELFTTALPPASRTYFVSGRVCPGYEAMTHHL